MTLDVWSRAVDIDRPADAVATYAFDPRNDPVWIGGISMAEQLDPAPLAVGSRVRRIASFLGRRIVYEMEVVDLAPGRRLAMHAVRSPFPMDVTYEFEPLGGGTRARIRVQGDPAGFYGLAGPLLGPAVRRSVTGDLRRLKRLLEAR